ncbi:MAG TPA: YCF48-related protein [Pyrinomonadaceae bacterium]|nr:YCF48-related protein [Pyrinomonadaceae bacterium]
MKQKSGSFAWLHSVFFVDARRGWAVGGRGALLSTADGGESWDARRAPTEDAIKDLFFTDGQTGWAVCERSIYMPMRKDESVAYLLKTLDGGASWTRVEVTKGEDVDVKLAGVRFADREHGWTFGEAGALFATTDGGASWTRQRVPTRHLLLGATFLDAQRGWIIGAGATALYTTDGGASWREGQLDTLPAQSPAHASSVRLNAVSFADAHRGWAVGAGGAVFKTSDGGRTWRAQASGTDADLFDVKFFDEREGRAVGGDGTAIHTTDGGATWHAEPTGTPHTLERLFFASRARGWAVGFGGTIIAFRE